MDDDEARAILRDAGEEPTKRGRLSKAAKDRAAELAGVSPEPEDAYDGGVSADDFGADVTEAAEPPAPVTEAKPRKVRSSKPGIRERLRSSTATSSKPKKKQPRVPVDALITSLWAGMGGMVAQIDRPLGVCLQMQAGVAGPVFEDIVKGTVADRALQPVARMGDKATKGAALIGPPLCVAGLEMAQRMPEPQRKAREAILWPMLIESLVLAERVAGDYAEKIAERAAQDGSARQRAERIARAMFGEVPDDATVERERATAGAGTWEATPN